MSWFSQLSEKKILHQESGCSVKLVKYKSMVNGTKYDIVPAMLRGIFSKTACYLTPQDLAKEMTGKH